MDFREFLLGNKDMIFDTNTYDDEDDAISELIQSWDSDYRLSEDGE